MLYFYALFTYSGTFGLGNVAPNGCWECICSRVPIGPRRCTSADGYRLDSIAANFSGGLDGFGTTDSVGILSNFFALETNR